MDSEMDGELAPNALLIAVWHRQPKQAVMAQSDRGGRFSSYDWRDFLKAHNLEQSVS